MRRFKSDLEDSNSYDSDLSLDRPKKQEMSVYHVSPLFGIGFCALLLVILWSVIAIDNKLPTGLQLSDEKTYPDSFIAERAKHDLKVLTQFGPRVVGSYENEVLAVDFLQREIQFIIQQSHVNQKIEVDLQTVNGSYYLYGKPFGKYNSYANLQNIVVKLYGNISEHSLLVNVHFDSVPTSPGGSDDGINCVAALEILRKLSRRQERLYHNIIFLFNGAEETGLHASHGFITQQKWAKSTKAVINLEAAGHGGKIILFQTGPQTPWIMKYYSKVPHPYGQVAGEEIFQSGIIPSDTDFRIFRDFGGLVGVDMAFFINGYRYHTKYDDFEHLPLGSYQHVGDNALSLVKEIANAPELGTKEKGGNVVFFDVLGLFMIYYPEEAAIAINTIIVIASLTILGIAFWEFQLDLSTSTFKFLGFSILGIFGGYLLAGFLVLIIGLILDATGYSMTWYGHPWIVLGLYCVPTIMGCSATLLLVQHKTLSLNIRSQILLHIERLIWTLVLLLGTIFKIRASYFIGFPIFFTTLAFILIHALRIHNSLRKWQIVYLVFLIIPLIYKMYSSTTTMNLFIPITGRAGSNKNFDVFMGLLCCVFTILVVSPLAPLVILMRKVKYFYIFLGTFFLINFIVAFTPLAFPYSGDVSAPTPQRYWTLHSRRVFYGEDGEVIKRDSGFFLLNMDRNSPAYVKNYVKEISNAKNFDEDCERFLLCGFPLAHPKMVGIISGISWIPSQSIPNIPDATNITVISKISIKTNTFRYKISIFGPVYTIIFLSPKKNNKLVQLSLDPFYMPHSNETLLWNERPLYVILHLWGKTANPCIFTFDIEAENVDNNNTIEIAINRLYAHGNVEKTVEHINFLTSFPNCKTSSWIPASQPLIPITTKLTIISKEQIKINVLRYTISISGPDRIIIYLSPKKGHQIYNLTLSDTLPMDTTLIWNDRPLFMIFHIWAKSPGPCVFSFDIDGNGNESVTTEISIIGIHVHNSTSKTASYLNFLKHFPNWADLTAWVASLESRFV